MRIKILLASLISAISLSGCNGCDEYASSYSCKHVVYEAFYDAYYWIESKDKYVYLGSSIGLMGCKNLAAAYALKIKEDWWDRAYICHLKKDGRIQEKHRLLM